jgi:hypothetical protein
MLFRLLLLSLSCSALTASFAATAGALPQMLYGKRIAGQVVDSDTRKPIAGAHVAFLWESPIIPSVFTGHNSRDICYHASVATTDADGRFEIAPWSNWSTYDVYVVEPTGVVYAPNYVPYSIVLSQKPGELPKEHLNERYVLKKFHGTTSERMYVLFWGLANHDCSYGGESQKTLYPMLKAIHDEAKKTARSEDDSRTVHSIARIAAEAALAQKPEGAWDPTEVDKFIRENMQ